MTGWQWAFLAYLVFDAAIGLTRALIKFRSGNAPPFGFAIGSLIGISLPFGLAYMAGTFA